MAIHHFNTETILPISLDEAWLFFSSPFNLSKITPPDMNFKVLTPLKENEFYEGMLIDYKVSPVFNIPMHWQTLISKVEDKKCFVDTQLKGPYKLWEHTHIFEEVKEGVYMKDDLKYELPLYFLGEIAHSLFVKNKINQIFEYRTQILNQIFKPK